MLFGKGRPLTKTPPSWLTSPHESNSFYLYILWKVPAGPSSPFCSKLYPNWTNFWLFSLDDRLEAGDTDDDCISFSEKKTRISAWIIIKKNEYQKALRVAKLQRHNSDGAKDPWSHNNLRNGNLRWSSNLLCAYTFTWCTSCNLMLSR